MLRIKRFRNKNNILKKVESNKYVIRFLFFVLACFIYALNYNIFLVPNSIVIGGMSGLAIVIKELTGFSTSTFLYISSGILVIVAYFTLGKEKVFNTLIGSLTFTLMVSLTEKISLYFINIINNDFIIILVCSLFIGIANGIIYRSGFNTGGSDVIASIINKYLKIPIGKCNSIVNTVIIVTGLIIFGIENSIYAVFILTISSKIIDVVMLGINDSKMVYIKSKKADEIKKYIIEYFNIGVTEITNSTHIFSKNDPILLVIIPFDLYFGVIQKIKEIDNSTFLVSHDCYAVLNGHKKQLLPF